MVALIRRRSSRLGLTLAFALAVVELGGIEAAQAAPRSRWRLYRLSGLLERK